MPLFYCGRCLLRTLCSILEFLEALKDDPSEPTDNRAMAIKFSAESRDFSDLLLPPRS